MHPYVTFGKLVNCNRCKPGLKFKLIHVTCIVRLSHDHPPYYTHTLVDLVICIMLIDGINFVVE